MIEKLNEKDILCLDFLQGVVNKKLADKINEIIDYINSKEV